MNRTIVFVASLEFHVFGWFRVQSLTGLLVFFGGGGVGGVRGLRFRVQGLGFGI